MKTRVKSMQIAILLSLLFPIHSIAQQIDENSNKNKEVESKKAIKLYSNARYSIEHINRNFNDDGIVIHRQTNYTWDIGYFSPALSFYRPNGNFHEIELSRLKINQEYSRRIYSDYNTNDSSVHILTQPDKWKTDFQISMRYEYDILLFKKNSESKFRAYLGMGLSPYFTQLSVNELKSTAFPFKQQIIGANMSFIPRFNYFFNENWFVDLNVPLDILGYRFTNTHVSNPGLELDDRTYQKSQMIAFPLNIQARLGLGFVIP